MWMSSCVDPRCFLFPLQGEPFFDGNIMVSCKFSLNPSVQWMR